MSHDLFLALKDPANRRGHPILAALLYAFCPAAAHWWRQGVEPDPPHDLVWQVLADRAGGRPLAEVLQAYGFESLLNDVRDYVERVRHYRGQNHRAAAPETLEVFRFEEIAPEKRHMLAKKIDQLGGDWAHFLEYARLWAFVYPDWVTAFNLAAAPAFESVRLAFALPGIQDPAYFPAWLWRSEGKRIRRILGLPAGDVHLPDQLRFMLAQGAGLEGEGQVEVWAVNPTNGEALAFEPRLVWEDLPAHLMALAGLAKAGSHPPLPAYADPGRCARCAFWRECYPGRPGEPLRRRKLVSRNLLGERDG